MKKFDKKFRGKTSAGDDWANWIKDGRYKYAVFYQSRLYPVKMIVSIATGEDRSDFSGGEASYGDLIELGFEVIRITDGSTAL